MRSAAMIVGWICLVFSAITAITAIYTLFTRGFNERWVAELSAIAIFAIPGWLLIKWGSKPANKLPDTRCANSGNTVSTTLRTIIGPLVALVALAAVGPVLFWWLSGYFYPWGLWPLDATTRVLASAATFGATVTALICLFLILAVPFGKFSRIAKLWLPSRKTFATGSFIIAISCAVCAYALYSTVATQECDKEGAAFSSHIDDDIVQVFRELRRRECVRERHLNFSARGAAFMLSRPAYQEHLQRWRLPLVGGLAGMVLGGAIALSPVLRPQSWRGWARQRLLPNLRPALGMRIKVAVAPVLTVLGVVILALSVFGFVQSSAEIDEIRTRYSRYSYGVTRLDTYQLFRSLSAAGLVVGVSMAAAGIFLLARRPR